MSPFLRGHRAGILASAALLEEEERKAILSGARFTANAHGRSVLLLRALAEVVVEDVEGGEGEGENL